MKIARFSVATFLEIPARYYKRMLPTHKKAKLLAGNGPFVTFSVIPGIFNETFGWFFFEKAASENLAISTIFSYQRLN